MQQRILWQAICQPTANGSWMQTNLATNQQKGHTSTLL